MKMPPLWRHFCTLNMIILSLMQRREYGVKERILAVLLALALLLCGCEPQQEEISQPESSSAVSEPEVSEEIAFLRENFPRIDGSTSLIPLEAGVRAAIFGKSFDEAQKDVVHSTTWGSFKNLLGGDADIIFSTPISAEQQKMADEAGIKLEQVPVVKEAFVFVVNAKNPVDALSQQQIKDIYSGKITNWKQVGGSDESIVAYQRNTDSGSQNYMIDFMGETPLMDAPTELRPGSMGGLMDVIAPNDGSLGSIGYSVYAYAADMYGTGDNIKFIKVDGAAPTKETIISGEYPLSSYNYAIFRADEPEEGAVRRLAEWMTSYDGQLAAAKAGYATVEDIGFDYEESAMAKYAAVGTGMKYPGSVPSYEFVPAGEAFDWNIYNFREQGSYEPLFIADENLRTEVKKFIAESAAKVTEDYDVMMKFIDVNTEGDGEWKTYSAGITYPYGNAQIDGEKYAVIATVKNGYLSVAVTMGYTYNVQDGYNRYYRTETAVWDMLSGKRLAPEELFYEGVDIAKALNDYVNARSHTASDWREGPIEFKTDFAGLTESGWHITADAIYFDNDNPYFLEGYAFSLDELPDGIMVTEQPRETGGALANGVTEAKRFREVLSTKEGKLLGGDNYGTYYLLKEDSYPGAKKINKFIEDYLNKYGTNEAVYGYYKGLGLDPDAEGNYFDPGSFDSYIRDFGGKYICFISLEPTLEVDNNRGDYTSTTYYYKYSKVVFFNPQTGEEIDWRDMISDEYENAKGSNYKRKSYDDKERYKLRWVDDGDDGFTFSFEDFSLYLTVPHEYINW